jgi:hypothetical protein
MNAPRDPDLLVRAFLNEGQTELADQVYDVVRATIEHRRQRAVVGPWRMPNIMNKFVPIGVGAAAVVVALVIGAQMLGSPAPVGVGATATATPSPAAEPTAIASPSGAALGGLPEGPFVVETGEGLPPITATIPGPGWTFDAAFDILGKGVDVENLPEASILLWAYPVGTGFDVYGDPCQWKSTPPDAPATTVDDFAEALAAQPSRDGSEPVDVTVGGYAGKSLTLHVPSDAVFEDCDDGNFTSYGVAIDAGTEPSRWHQGPGQIDELWILDVGGTTVVLDAMYRSDTSAELIEELRAIATSATFTTP